MSFLAPKNRYHQDPAKLDTTNYGGTIGNAAQNAQQVYGQQQQVQAGLANTAAGRGPNPAKEMLRQQTGQNVNMAAGQAASARSANPALAARLAVDSASQMNQQAAGQGATMQAQQSLAAQQAMAQNAQAMQQGQMGMFTGAGQLQNAQNQANIANVLGTGQINAGVNAQNAGIQAQLLGGLMNGAGAAAGMAAAHGGEITPGGVRRYAEGGPVEQPSPLHAYMQSLYGLAGGGEAGGFPGPAPVSIDSPQHDAYMDAAPARAEAMQAAQPAGGQAGGRGLGQIYQGDGGMAAFQSFAGMRTPGLALAQGGPVSYSFEGDGFVPGQPEVPGDDEENDNVPALLSPGEIVIPRSIAQSPNAPEQSASFVAHLMRRQGREGDGFDRLLKARQYAEGGAVQDPETFQRRTLPPDEPMGRAGGHTPPVGLLPVYTGDSDKARAEEIVRRAKPRVRPEKLAEGGEVEAEPEEPGLVDRVKAWLFAPPGEATDKARNAVNEGANEALPDWLSARAAILKKRQTLRDLDEQTKE